VQGRIEKAGRPAQGAGFNAWLRLKKTTIPHTKSTPADIIAGVSGIIAAAECAHKIAPLSLYCNKVYCAELGLVKQREALLFRATPSFAA
jgi:hypothetical protein